MKNNPIFITNFFKMDTCLQEKACFIVYNEP